MSGSRHLGQVVKVIHRQLSVSLCLPLFNQWDNSRWQRSSAKYRLLAGHCCHGTGTSSAVVRTGGKKTGRMKFALGQNPSVWIRLDLDKNDRTFFARGIKYNGDAIEGCYIQTKTY